MGFWAWGGLHEEGVAEAEAWAQAELRLWREVAQVIKPGWVGAKRLWGWGRGLGRGVGAGGWLGAEGWTLVDAGEW